MDFHFCFNRWICSSWIRVLIYEDQHARISAISLWNSIGISRLFRDTLNPPTSLLQHTISFSLFPYQFCSLSVYRGSILSHSIPQPPGIYKMLEYIYKLIRKRQNILFHSVFNSFTFNFHLYCTFIYVY